MIFLNYCIKHGSFQRNFLQSFRNVQKLKDILLRPICKNTRTFHVIKYHGPQFKIQTPFLFDTRKIFAINCPNRCMSRWTKYSPSSMFVNQNSRKKYRIRSVQFAERVRVKIQTARRETRRTVQKKIVEIRENILTVPNGLCALRIISTPFLGYLVISEFYIASFGLFIFAGFTDLVDGYIARNFQNQQSMIGSFLDPAADKLLISTLFVTLTVNGLIPVPLTTLIIMRDVFLMGAGFYIRYVSLPPPKTLSRYFNMSLVTAKLSPTTLSKGNTLVQLSLVGASLAAPVFGYVDHLCLHMLWYLTGATTVLSAVGYLSYRNTYKLFTLAEKKSKT